MTTFYNQEGKAIAYTEDGEHIYLFNGSPAGFIEKDSVFSYSGKHLGCIKEGWIVDQQGRRVFFTEDASGGPSRPVKQVTPVKSVKAVKPVKGTREMRPTTPTLTMSWSDFSSKSFFEQ